MTDPLEGENADGILLDLSDIHLNRGRALLSGVYWRVRRGENWVILGRNGCGKSVLLQTLTGYLAPSAGVIKLLGKQYGRYDWRELRKEVGIVASHLLHRLEEGEPVIDVIASGARAMINASNWLETAEIVRAKQLLSISKLDKLANSTWGTLSQGEKQRVLILRAMMIQPKLLILDEPCTGLDPVAREEFLEFIDTIAQNARQTHECSIILVTHHLDEIMPSFTHVLLLKEGKVVRSGGRDEVLIESSLSETFGRQVSLKYEHDRYELTLRRSGF